VVLDDTSCFQTSDYLPRFVFIQAYSCPGVPDSHETYIPAKTITNTKELIFPNTMVSTRTRTHTHTHTHTHTKTEVTANQLTKTRECAMAMWVIGLKAEYFGICPRQGNPISLVLVLSRKNTVAGAENKTIHSFFERHPRVWRYFLFCCFEDKFTYQLSPALFRMIVLKAVLSNSNLRPSLYRAICGLPSKQQLWGFGRGIKQSDPRSKGTNFLIQSSDSILL